MNRSKLRWLSIAALFAASAILVYLGHQGWVVYDILPLQNLGYILAGVALLGSFGVNIFYGGPLDRIRDTVASGPAAASAPDPLTQARWDAAHSSVRAWGATWEAVLPLSGLQQELDRELTADHPLTKMSPVVFGRCQSCDDVVATLHQQGAEPALAVVHLTWRGRAEQKGWPAYEIVTTDDFIARFVEQGYHS
jgi:hypothetical protein